MDGNTGSKRRGSKDSTGHPACRTGKQIDGDAGEQIAADWLQTQGLQIIARNVRFRGGEIDLVCLDRTTLVFVEVRLRRSEKFGGAASSITLGKRARIILAAQLFIQQNARWSNSPARFDCILLTGLESPQPEWIRNAFDAA